MVQHRTLQSATPKIICKKKNGLFSSFMYCTNSTFSQCHSFFFFSLATSWTILWILSPSCRQLHLSLPVFCVALVLVLLMSKLLIYCPLFLIFCLCWLCHFLSTLKYKVLDTIVLAFIILLCGIFLKKYDSTGQLSIGKIAQVAWCISQFFCSIGNAPFSLHCRCLK